MPSSLRRGESFDLYSSTFAAFRCVLFCISGEKIVVKNPVVELDGDEMTRIIWKKIREEVLYPPWSSFLDVELTLVPFAIPSFISTAHPSVLAA